MSQFFRGAAIGALCGAAVFLADLVVTALRWGQRFEPSAETFQLVAFVALFSLVPGLILGGLLGLVFRGRATQAWALPPAAFLVAGLGFYVLGDEQRTVPDGMDKVVSSAGEEGRKVDVLWLVIDTLRADALYGSGLQGAGAPDELSFFPDAPALGALAESSTVFLEAEAPSGWTIPSTAALLTGRHPSTLGARAGLLPAGADTLAEILQAAGWKTIAHVDNTLLDESNGFAAGFQRFEKRSAMDFGWRLLTSKLLPKDMRENFRHRLHISYSGADSLVDRAIEDLELAGDAPLFLYVHAMDVHAPYWTELRDDALAKVARGIHGMDGTGRDQARKDANSLSEEQKQAIRAQYLAELEFVDRELGRLLEHFAAERGLENALVVVTADHGEEFWEHGKMGHGLSLWGEVVRVPLILHAPRDLVPQPAGKVMDPVSLIDVAPTVVDLLGLEVEGGSFAFEGRSLVPVLEGEPLPERPLHSEQFRFNRTTHRWREGNLVLVDARLPDDQHLVRLFDVIADPLEAHDLSGDRPDDLTRLQAALAKHLAGIERGGVRRGAAQTNSAGLEHLGY